MSRSTLLVACCKMIGLYVRHSFRARARARRAIRRFTRSSEHRDQGAGVAFPAGALPGRVERVQPVTLASSPRLSPLRRSRTISPFYGSGPEDNRVSSIRLGPLHWSAPCRVRTQIIGTVSEKAFQDNLQVSFTDVALPYDKYSETHIAQSRKLFSVALLPRGQERHEPVHAACSTARVAASKAAWSSQRTDGQEQLAIPSTQSICRTWRAQNGRACPTKTRLQIVRPRA
jgi:hypothetical protein